MAINKTKSFNDNKSLARADAKVGGNRSPITGPMPKGASQSLKMAHHAMGTLGNNTKVKSISDKC